MKLLQSLGVVTILILPLIGPVVSAGPGDAPALYVQHCAQCHGADRLGLMGPALLPENLTRLTRDAAIEIVGSGRAATQMPPFGQVLDEGQIAALVDFVYTPLAETPAWGRDKIQASHKIL